MARATVHVQNHQAAKLCLDCLCSASTPAVHSFPQQHPPGSLPAETSSFTQRS
ncbi:hypothetical protein M431DRAFT_503782 [Trichoderma harzianum CBS 226.95]|uniref:Uncharacterized protein n=1 Tax=Trichoderma harzianum CBS 226.95 TaxID=983964 RepID=A0A2T4APJ2_TRIHA|nr:hypothetical protein M431DRAFT_503782 [Trichoderma harzianum CBS 226.95]PTB58828.1 hypothetical protein M431DRAFT_503782 [Trichoderma harzianum CBS 226.95]